MVSLLDQVVGAVGFVLLSFVPGHVVSLLLKMIGLLRVGERAKIADLDAAKVPVAAHPERVGAGHIPGEQRGGRAMDSTSADWAEAIGPIHIGAGTAWEAAWTLAGVLLRVLWRRSPEPARDGRPRPSQGPTRPLAAIPPIGPGAAAPGRGRPWGAARARRPARRRQS